MTLSVVQLNRERMDQQGARKAQIRKGVPLPPKHKPGIAQEFPNLRAMAVGDSFEIPMREGMTYEQLSKAITSAIRIRTWQGAKFKARKTLTGVGVWRVS